MRGEVLAFATEDHALVLGIHHIVYDGWSTQVLLADLRDAYRTGPAGADGDPAVLDAVADRVLARSGGSGGRRRLAPAEARFWSEALAGTDPLDLPLDRPRPERSTFAGAAVSRSLDAATTARIDAAARRHGVTRFAVLLAGFALTMERITGQAEMVLGVPTAGREDGSSQALVGFFANTLPLRLDPGRAGGLEPLIDAAGAALRCWPARARR